MPSPLAAARGAAVCAPKRGMLVLWLRLHVGRHLALCDNVLCDMRIGPGAPCVGGALVGLGLRVGCCRAALRRCECRDMICVLDLFVRGLVVLAAAAAAFARGLPCGAVLRVVRYGDMCAGPVGARAGALAGFVRGLHMLTGLVCMWAGTLALFVRGLPAGGVCAAKCALGPFVRGLAAWHFGFVCA